MRGVSPAAPPPLSAIKVPGARRVYLARGADGFGFRLSTNSKTLDSGYSHYASEVDEGGLAEIAGLRVGDRFLEIDGRSVVSIPHNYVKAVFGKAGVNGRPLRCVVCPPNELILSAIRAKEGVEPEKTPVYHPEPPITRPALELGLPLPRFAGRDGCHLVVSATGSVFCVEAAEADFGAELPADGLVLELFHDPTNPTASRRTRGGEGRAVLVLLEEGTVAAQAAMCEEGGARACVVVNRKADQAPRALTAETAEAHERVSIPVVNISMRDGIALAKRLRNGQIAATLHAWQRPAYDESDIGTQISIDDRATSTGDGHEDEVNPGLHLEIDGEDCGFILAGQAEFGEYLPEDGLRLEIVSPEDPKAADPFSTEDANRAHGRGVLVERGGLKIAQKVLHCEQAGALACIVANTTHGGQAFNIARTEDGGPEDHVSIPTLAIGTDDGRRIMDAVASGRKVVATMYHYLPEEEQLPEGWIAEERADGETVYVNEETGETMHEYPTPDAIVKARLERREREREAAEARAAEAERRAAEMEQRLAAQAAALEEAQRRADEAIAEANRRSAQASREGGGGYGGGYAPADHEDDYQRHSADDAYGGDAQHDEDDNERDHSDHTNVYGAAYGSHRDEDENEDDQEHATSHDGDGTSEPARDSGEYGGGATWPADDDDDGGVTLSRADRDASDDEMAPPPSSGGSMWPADDDDDGGVMLSRADRGDEDDMPPPPDEDDDDDGGLGDALNVLNAVIGTDQDGDEEVANAKRSSTTDDSMANPFAAPPNNPFAAFAAPPPPADKDDKSRPRSDSNPFAMAFATTTTAAKSNDDPFAVVAVAKSTSDDDNLVEVDLHKEEGQMWGIKMTESREGLVIKETPGPNSMAGKPGIIKQGMLIVSVNGTSCLGMDKSDLRPLMGTNDVHMVLRTAEGAEKTSASSSTTAAAAVVAAPKGEPAVCKYNGGPGKTCSKKAADDSEFCTGHTCPTCDASKSSRAAWCTTCALDGGAAGKAKKEAKEKAKRDAEMARAAKENAATERARREEKAAASAAAAAAAAEDEAAALARDGPIVVMLDKKPGLKLGLKVGNKKGVNAVKKVIEGGLAATTTMKPGMIIVAVNGQRCEGLSKEECVGLLTGTGMMEIRLRNMSPDELVTFGANRRDSVSSIGSIEPVPMAATPTAASTSASSTPAMIGSGPKPEWLHGQLGREESEAMLLKHGTADGTFLVRERQNDGEKPAYGLAVTFRGKATHHKIRANNDGKLVLGKFTPYPDGKGSTTVAELVAFLASINPPDKMAPGWPVKLVRGVRPDGSLVLLAAGASRSPMPTAEPAVCKYNGGPGKTCSKKAAGDSEFCTGHTCPTCDQAKSSRAASCASCEAKKNEVAVEESEYALPAVLSRSAAPMPPPKSQSSDAEVVEDEYLLPTMAKSAAREQSSSASSAARAPIEAKYAKMKRLAMVKECRAKGIDTTSVGKDEDGLRKLLVDYELEAAAVLAAAEAEAASVSGGILRNPAKKSRLAPGTSVMFKSDDELVEVETVPRQRNEDEETDQYALYQCRFAYTPAVEGFTEGDDLLIEPGDILQVYDEGGLNGLPQTPEEKEADPNCWMRGWTQDDREGTFPASYVSKIVLGGDRSVRMDPYGAGAPVDDDDDRVTVGE